MERVLIFLDELYEKRDNKYYSKFNAGRFLLDLREEFNLTYMIPVSRDKKQENYTTVIDEKMDVIEMSEWNSLISFMKNYKRNSEDIIRKIKPRIDQYDCLWVRLPSIPGLIVAEYFIKQNKKVIFHLAGDIRDAYRTGKYKKSKAFFAYVIGSFVHNKTISLIKKSSKKTVLCTGGKLMEDFKEFNPKFFLDNEYNLNANMTISKDEALKNILYVGRLVDEKGIKYLVEAHKNLEDYIKLHIVGTGPLDEYIVEEGKNNSNLVFHGFKSGEDLDKIYSMCQCLIVPSTTTEGFPRVIAEAWSRGLAVLSTDVGGIGYLGKEGRNIKYFKAKDSNNLLEVLEGLYNDRKLLYSLRANGVSTAREISKDSMYEIIRTAVKQ